MRIRRVELRLTWRQVAERAGLSLAGMNAVRHGQRNPTELTRRAIESALDWSPGSVDAVLEGGEPSAAEARQGEPTLEELERARRLLIDALRMDDDSIEAMREKLADALALVGRALDYERRDAAG